MAKPLISLRYEDGRGPRRDIVLRAWAGRSEDIYDLNMVY